MHDIAIVTGGGTGLGYALAEELLKLQKALDDRLAESLPATCQLGGTFRKGDVIESDFMI